MKKQQAFDTDDSVMEVGDYLSRKTYDFIKHVPMAQNKGDIYYFLDSRQTADLLEIKDAKGNPINIRLGGCEARNGKVPVYYDNSEQNGIGLVDIKTGLLQHVMDGSHFGLTAILSTPVNWVDDHTLFTGQQNRYGYSGMVIDLQAKQVIADVHLQASDFILHDSSIWYCLDEKSGMTTRLFPLPSHQNSAELEVSIIIPDSKKDLELEYAGTISARLKNTTDHDIEIGTYAISLWYETEIINGDNKTPYYMIESIVPNASSNGNIPSTKLKAGESMIINNILVDPQHWDFSAFMLRLVLTFPGDKQDLKGIFASPRVYTIIK